MKKSCDVLVVGGGVIGLFCAYYLLMAGRRVTIIEQNEVGTGASHGNCGIIATSDLPPLCGPGVISNTLGRIFRRTSPLYLKPELNLSRLLWLLNFARKCAPTHFQHAVAARERLLVTSRKLFDTVLSEEPLDCDWDERGLLFVVSNEAAMQRYAPVADLLRSYGLTAEPYVGRSLYNLEPAMHENVYGGWLHTADAHLRPDRLMSALKALLTVKDVEIIENCRLQGLSSARQGGMAAATSCGTLTARDIVIAAGAYTGKLLKPLGINLPIQPGKGYSITMNRPLICPTIPTIFMEESVVATSWPSGYRLGGTMEFSGFNTEVISERMRNLRRVAHKYLKTPVGDTLVEEWVGLRPMVYDDLPIIDRTPGHNNLFVASGHGMIGLSTATATGKLLAELVTGQTPFIDPTPFGIRRFE